MGDPLAEILLRQNREPLSSLRKVTRSMTPEICSVEVGAPRSRRSSRWPYFPTDRVRRSDAQTIPHALEYFLRRLLHSPTTSSFWKPRWKKAKVAPDTRHVHTSTMPLKNAALLALIGTILMTALLVWNFVLTFLNVLRDLVPAVTMFSSFIYAFGCFSLAVFFYLFHRAQ